MKVIGGHIANFPPFTNKEIPTLHKDIVLFYGNNENGKSSLFDFIKRILFSIPNGTHLKSNNWLRIVEGELLIAYQNRTERITNEHGNPLCIGEFKNRFLINLDDLALSSNKDYYKDIISSAMGGIDYTRLNEYRKQIDKDIEGLFLKSANAKNATANGQLRSISQISEQLKKLKETLGSDAYQCKLKRIQQLETEVILFRQKQKTINDELQKLQRLLGIQPNVSAYLSAKKALQDSDLLEESKHISWLLNFQKLSECKEEITKTTTLLDEYDKRIKYALEQNLPSLTAFDIVLLTNQDKIAMLSKDASVIINSLAEVKMQRQKLEKLSEEFMLKLEYFDSDSATRAFSPELFDTLSFIAQEYRERGTIAESLRTAFSDFLLKTEHYETVQLMVNVGKQNYDNLMKAQMRQNNQLRLAFSSIAFICLIVSIYCFLSSHFAISIFFLIGLFACLYMLLVKPFSKRYRNEAAIGAETVKQDEDALISCRNELETIKQELDNMANELSLKLPPTKESIQQYIHELISDQKQLEELEDLAKLIHELNTLILTKTKSLETWFADAENMKANTNDALPWSETEEQWPTQLIQWSNDLREADKHKTESQVCKAQLEKEQAEEERTRKTQRDLLDKKNKLLQDLRCLSIEDAQDKFDNYHKMTEYRKKVEDAEFVINDTFINEIHDALGDDKGAARIAALRNDLKVVEQELQEPADSLAILKQECQEMVSSNEIEELITKKESLLEELKEYYRLFAMSMTKKALLEQAQSKYMQTMTFFSNCSQILSVITAGKWVEFKQNNGEYFLVDCDKNTYKIEDCANFLSRGMIEQLYLSIRLAFDIEYRKEAEPFPIILDDVFVNFDDARKTNVLMAIKEHVAKNGQQVIMFAASESFARMTKKVLDNAVQIIKIENQNFITEDA